MMAQGPQSNPLHQPALAFRNPAPHRVVLCCCSPKTRAFQDRDAAKTALSHVQEPQKSALFLPGLPLVG